MHAFAEVSFKNAYITPRGLVVTTGGLTIQPLPGIVFIPLSDAGALDKLSLVTGVWNDLDARQSDAYVGVWNEFDYFLGLSARLAKSLELDITYLLFTSPSHHFKPEHNIELKVAFDDSVYFKTVTFRPYLRVFYAVAGDSTVVLGDKGGTYDVEPGLVPSYKVQVSASYPINLTLPTFVTIGPRGFFGADGALGVFSTGPVGSVPLSFIAERHGSWHLDAGITYYRLINDNLVSASRLLGNSGRRDEFVGTARIGMSF